MVHLFDIARRAHGGAGFDVLSRQFGLDAAQTQRALEALLPAFTLAFQRKVTNPASFADMLGMVASGRYASFYDGAGAWPGPAGRGAGDRLLEQLFGSLEVGKVAAQASAVTGLGAHLLQQMMPALAATLVGGMFRYASIEGFADLLGQWSAAIKAAVPAKRPAPADPWSAWAEVAGRMMGGGSSFAAPPPPPADTPFEAWTKAVGGMLGQAQPRPEPPRRESPRSEPPPQDPLQAVLQMFETGREVQSQHLADLRRIVDAAWTAPVKADGSQ